MVWVLPGVDDVLARFLRCVSILIKDDLPTFERPIKANSGLSGMGHLLTCVLLIINSADVISMCFCLINVYDNSQNYGMNVTDLVFIDFNSF